MTPIAQYCRQSKTWIAFFFDQTGAQVGPATTAPTKELAMFLLGRDYGQHPVKFAQPISKFFKELESENSFQRRTA